MASARRGSNREGRMTLSEHFVELRKRLFRCALAVVVGTVVGWLLAGPVMDVARRC